tara:strand:+ start:6546 stop:7025 length:480 start_codon:yes stop_codon:yes gene_type:complete
MQNPKVASHGIEMATFSAQVSSWVAETRARIDAVARQSAQDVIEETRKPRSRGGRMRYDTGFLASSLMASTASMPNIKNGNRPDAGGSYSPDSGQVSLVIAGWNVGEPLYAGFTADYALHREYGSNGQAGDAFVRSAAMRWQEFVSKNARELKRRSTGF